jgi:hypothetical protein
MKPPKMKPPQDETSPQGIQMEENWADFTVNWSLSTVCRDDFLAHNWLDMSAKERRKAWKDLAWFECPVVGCKQRHCPPHRNYHFEEKKPDPNLKRSSDATEQPVAKKKTLRTRCMPPRPSGQQVEPQRSRPCRHCGGPHLISNCQNRSSAPTPFWTQPQTNAAMFAAVFSQALDRDAEVSRTQGSGRGNQNSGGRGRGS